MRLSAVVPTHSNSGAFGPERGVWPRRRAALHPRSPPTTDYSDRTLDDPTRRINALRERLRASAESTPSLQALAEQRDAERLAAVAAVRAAIQSPEDRPEDAFLQLRDHLRGVLATLEEFGHGPDAAHGASPQYQELLDLANRTGFLLAGTQELAQAIHQWHRDVQAEGGLGCDVP
jgi:hypothetical protein